MYIEAGSNVATVLAKGNKIWMYNALVQDAYSPKWQVDFAPINYRIMPGFDGQVFGFTGILYSGVDLWTSDPWNNLDTPQSGYHFNGEDILVYPGAQVGLKDVVPSMRLKYLRDGVDDFEYIQMLKNQGQGTWAMGLVHTVVTDWAHWTQDPVVLESVRYQLGAKLDQLAGGAIPQASPCDVNRDGSTNVVDVQLAVNQALGLVSCTADISKDGKCDIVEVQRVVNAALGGLCVSP
jgi:hypothetical protein